LKLSADIHNVVYKEKWYNCWMDWIVIRLENMLMKWMYLSKYSLETRL